MVGWSLARGGDVAGAGGAGGDNVGGCGAASARHVGFWRKGSSGFRGIASSADGVRRGAFPTRTDTFRENSTFANHKHDLRDSTKRGARVTAAGVTFGTVRHDFVG